MDIIVVAHKRFDSSILPEGYLPVAVGDYGGDSSCPYQSDRGGYSIWEKNPYYCELTAQYWAWKNLNTDICGLVHYRRYFMDYHKEAKAVTDNILRKERIQSILSKYKVILSFKHVKGPGAGVYYFDVPEENNDFHWRVLRSVIEERYPDYMKTFKAFMNNEFYSPCNMFISSKAVFDQYSEWLFNVLAGYDEALESQGIERQARVDGFLSECLLNIFFLHNFSEEEIYRMDFVNTENKAGYKYPGFVRTNHGLMKILEGVKSGVKYFRNTPSYIKHKRSLQ